MEDTFTPLQLQVEGASLRFCRYGGQVLSWQPADGQERLFLSDRSLYQSGQAIRGGVPIIFPQFSGRGSLPKHGFARDRAWALLQWDEDSGQAELELRESLETLQIWPFAFRLVLKLQLRPQQLQLQLTVENCDRQPWSFTAALHSYLAVPDLATVHLQGLQGRWGTEQTTGDRWQEMECDRHFPQAIDALYEAPAQPLTLLAPPWSALQICQTGFTETVIWNPGSAGVSQIGDLASGSEQQFLCVEAAVVQSPPRLEPGEIWQGQQVFQVG
ncbi:D-hexose-6-phosphate mutarotase [Synechococcus elongatus]|nr:D-hexose-6-phosphate mutarotase [Synechococcus elongatus]WKW06430.1 D-hexose-6-phosphate mutarotase [Synechococcus elongatus PCC 7942 = FACHB-805]